MSLSDKIEYYVEIQYLYDDKMPEYEIRNYENKDNLRQGYIENCILAEKEAIRRHCRFVVVTAVIFDRSNYDMLFQKFAFSGKDKTLDSDEEIIKKINSSWTKDMEETK